jgi:hypothetical protein
MAAKIQTVTMMIIPSLLLGRCVAASAIESDSSLLNQTRRSSFGLSMIFSENRIPLFGIML